MTSQDPACSRAQALASANSPERTILAEMSHCAAEILPNVAKRSHSFLAPPHS